MELPFYSKFLLIAAYLASYNPARTDRRFFMKYHGKQKKTKAMIKVSDSLAIKLIYSVVLVNTFLQMNDRDRNASAAVFGCCTVLFLLVYFFSP